ncbi:MAG: ATP-binding protein, partial [Angelakisella sp.]
MIMDTLMSTELHRQAVATIAGCTMFEHGDRVAVGVSGGADSVALLVFLQSVRDQLGLTLLVCHVNHRLRGEESDGDAAFVRDLCNRLELP